MKFNWKALALAPMAAPLIFTLAITVSLANQSKFSGFLFFFILGSIFSYGAAMVLFAPCIFVLSMFGTLRAYYVCALGTFLGAFSYLPLTWGMYQSSGPNSGPPEGTYLEYFFRSLADPAALFFPLGGLITATAYCLLANGLFRRKAPPDAVAIS